MQASLKKVLVVDDDPDCRDFVESVLDKIGGCEVLTADDGKEVAATARQQRLDLIVMDVIMPEKDGYTAFCELQADPSTRRTPVIMLTSLADLDGYLGGNPQAPRPRLFVAKPIDPDRLEKMIQQVFAQG